MEPNGRVGEKWNCTWDLSTATLITETPQLPSGLHHFVENSYANMISIVGACDMHVELGPGKGSVYNQLKSTYEKEKQG